MKTQLGIESSWEDEYEDPSSDEGYYAVVDNGYDEDHNGDDSYNLHVRMDVYSLQGWSAIVRERPTYAGFLVPEPPIGEANISFKNRLWSQLGAGSPR